MLEFVLGFLCSAAVFYFVCLRTSQSNSSSGGGAVGILSPRRPNNKLVKKIIAPSSRAERMAEICGHDYPREY